jgi:hypothetical protein
MDIYETKNGYIVTETLGGLEVTEDDRVICTLNGKTLEDYCDEDENIDDDALEADIREGEEVEDFLAYQNEYC